MKIEIAIYNEDKEMNKQLNDLILSDYGEEIIANAIHEALQKQGINGSDVIVDVKENI